MDAKEKIILALVMMMGITMYILFIWGERYIKQNEVATGILIIIVVTILGIDFIKNSLKKRKKENKLIFVSVDFDLIKYEVCTIKMVSCR